MNAQYLHVPKRHVALWLLLMILTGPLLPIAHGLKRWANASSFDMPDRWASVRAFAVMFALPYATLGLLLLLPPLAEQKSLMVLWIRQHTFLFELSSLWSWTLGILLLLWFLTQPMAFWLALALQDWAPENALHYTRVALPGEIPSPQSNAMQPVAANPVPVPQPAEQKPATTSPAPASQPAEQKPKRRRTSTPKKKEKPLPPMVQLQPPEEPTAQATISGLPRHSLWDQTDWSTIPDNDPVKQLALEEDRQRRSRQTCIVEPPVEAPTPQEPPVPADAPAQKKRIDWSKVDE